MKTMPRPNMRRIAAWAGVSLIMGAGALTLLRRSAMPSTEAGWWREILAYVPDNLVDFSKPQKWDHSPLY